MIRIVAAASVALALVSCVQAGPRECEEKGGVMMVRVLNGYECMSRDAIINSKKQV